MAKEGANDTNVKQPCLSNVGGMRKIPAAGCVDTSEKGNTFTCFKTAEERMGTFLPLISYVERASSKGAGWPRESHIRREKAVA